MSRTVGSKSKGASKHSRSRLKGVYINPRGAYCASLHLGTYETPQEAERAYNEAARKVFGRHVFQNPLPEREACPNPRNTAAPLPEKEEPCDED